MTGLQSAPVGSAKYVTTFAFTSHFNSMSSYSTTALVVKSISSNLPSEKLRKEDWHHTKGLVLADPNYHQPDKIDVLLGTDVFWTLLENEKISGKDGQPFAVKSTIGWLIAGPNINSSLVTVFVTNAELSAQLSRYWEQETTEESTTTEEEKACEDHFNLTYQRDSRGRFTVSLPPKTSNPKLGSSRNIAIRRFLSLENKFVHFKGITDCEKIRKLSDQWKQYQEFMFEYEQLGHMEVIPYDELQPPHPTYYIPHHSVLKESSTTTRLRVVFDASAVTSTGVSLNDCLLVGPKLQDNLTDIMLRFRLHPIAFTADIAKMYRQIMMKKEDADLQRIIWRSNPKEPLKEYRLLTVTYGTASAPYQAVKCLQELAQKEEKKYPEAAAVVKRDFYIDDTASGADTLEQAKKIVKQLMDLCMSGGFEL